HHRRVLLAHAFLTQVIKAQIGHDPVNPGVEGALKTKAADVLVGLEEGVLVDVLSFVLGAGEMKSEPQHRLVVMPHQFLEGSAVAKLRLADQHRIVNAAFLPSHAAPRDGVLVLTDYATAQSLHPLARRPREDPLANRKWYSPC